MNYQHITILLMNLFTFLKFLSLPNLTTVTMNVVDPYTGEKRFFLLAQPKSPGKHAVLISLHGYGSNAKE